MPNERRVHGDFLLVGDTVGVWWNTDGGDTITRIDPYDDRSNRPELFAGCRTAVFTNGRRMTLFPDQVFELVGRIALEASA